MGRIGNMFDPKTVALIGATEKENTVGRIILDNLLLSKQRKVFPVNPKRAEILGIACYANINNVPEPVDLAVIAIPATAVPQCVEECGLAGVGGIIIVSSGFREIGAQGKQLEEEIITIRKKYGMRIIGPNCLGIIRPNIDLNTTLIKDKPEKGHIAFITESEGFGRALLDWGINAHIGFSMYASLGSMIDVDFGDLIDFLGQDPYTRSIMLYMEGDIGDVKKFASAAKGFAHNKPIIVLRPDRPQDYNDNGLTQSHTGVLADKERVYDAVFKRIGIVRVKEAADIFNAASVLYSKRLPKGQRLLIITNASGVGIMATSTLFELGGELAQLSEESFRELDAYLPSHWSKTNPVYLLRDADIERFARSISICLKDPGVDGVLIIYTPQGAATSMEFAGVVIDLAERSQKPIITSCMGGKDTLQGKELLHQHNIPNYDTPEEAVKTYLYMYQHERNLQLLYETPSELAVDRAPPKNNLKVFIGRAMEDGVSIITGEESERFLTNYGIPVVRTHTVQNIDEALYKANDIGYPIVLKVVSPDIIDRIDVGGVMTDISSDEELRVEFERLQKRVTEKAPTARITGMTIQKMLDNIDYEVILGAKRDREFGSVILFGMGGVGVHIFNDFSVGLPPLNQTLARRLMEETKVYKMLQGYRGKMPADLRQLEKIVVAFSNLIVDFPEITEMDINPIAISKGKAYALDARIVFDRGFLTSASQYPHLIITPYPVRYIMPWSLSDGKEVLLRPVRPEDEPMEHEMLTTLSEETLRTRFFQTVKNITHEMHVRFCNIDYDREMAIVAEVREDEKRKIIGMGRLIIERTFKSAEYAVLVHDNYHGKGLGYKLMDVLIGIAQDKGLEEFYGYVQTGNRQMLKICKRLGFAVEPLPENICKVRLVLK
jgi:acetyltransferase